MIDEARGMLNSSHARRLHDTRIAPFEDIIYENQIILRGREVQGSRLNNHGNYQNKAYSSNPV